MALSYLTGSAVQGSANAFVQSEISSGLAGGGNIAYRVREILFEWNPMALTGDADRIELCLTRRSKTAMPVITDRDVLAKFARGNGMTTSGLAVSDGVVRYAFGEDDELIIVEDPLYFQVDSDGLGAVHTGYVRIGYTRETISAVDRLTLLTQSLE